MNFKKDGPSWFFSRWREICAVVFLILVMFDFIIAPTFYEILYKPEPMAQIVVEAQKLSPDAQTIFITTAMSARQHLEWQPLTLGGNGMVYLCFMAILGIASWKANPNGTFPQNPNQPPQPPQQSLPMKRQEDEAE